MAMLKTKDGGINWKAEHRKELAWATQYEEKRIREMRFWFDMRHHEDHADTTPEGRVTTRNFSGQKLDYERCRKEFYRNRKQLRWIRSYIARTARKLVAQYKSTSY